MNNNNISWNIQILPDYFDKPTVKIQHVQDFFTIVYISCNTWEEATSLREETLSKLTNTEQKS